MKMRYDEAIIIFVIITLRELRSASTCARELKRATIR